MDENNQDLIGAFEEYEEDDEELEEDENEEENDEEEKRLKRARRRNRILLIIIIILLLLLGSCGIMWKKTKDACGADSQVQTALSIDKNQGEYSAEEEANNYVKQISLPGWGAFNIPANTATITKGFEFHNPDENEWDQDTVSINGTEIETFIVGDSEVEIDHLLRLAGIESSVVNVKSYDSKYFESYKNTDGNLAIKGTNGFDGAKEIIVETEDGSTVTLDVTSKHDFYYMTFGLYLGDSDDAENAELLYQSNLVEPGKYIQHMEMSKSLRTGSYEAFVVCQPYKSDGATKTNNGIVKITLNVY